MCAAVARPVSFRNERLQASFVPVRVPVNVPGRRGRLDDLLRHLLARVQVRARRIAFAGGGVAATVPTVNEPCITACASQT